MKTVWLIVLLFFSLDVVCQKNEKLTLPKPEEVERIEISSNGMVNWYVPEELLELLPKFVPSEGTYLTKGAFQRGVFILKNGKKITWIAGGRDSILLYGGGKKQQFYILPEQPKAKKKRYLAEPLFFIWDGKGKEGFMDMNGNVVLSGFDAVGGFSEGLAPVLVGDKWGYIDRTGKVVIQPRWKNNNDWPGAAVGAFSDGLAAVTEYASWGVRDDSNYWTYKCGYIDKTGEYVIKPQMRQACGPFRDGLAAVEVDLDGPEDTKDTGWLGYIDTKGSWAIPPKFFKGGTFSEGYALVSDEMDMATSEFKRHLIDIKGSRVTGVKDCRWRYRFSEGLALAFSDKEKRYDGYINENCEYVFRLPADVSGEPGLSNFSQGLAAVYQRRLLLPGEESYNTYRKETWGYIDKTGKVVIPFKYDSASSFSEGLAAVREDKHESVYIDPRGNVVLNKPGGGSFHNGLAYQYLFTWTIHETPAGRNIRGYMNKQGKYIWLSPGAEIHLGKKWIKENYIGPQTVSNEQ